MSNREDKTNPRHIKPPKAAFLSGSGGLSLAKTKESLPGDTAERGRSTYNPVSAPAVRGWPPRETPEGFLFVATKRNPSDSASSQSAYPSLPGKPESSVTPMLLLPAAQARLRGG